MIKKGFTFSNKSYVREHAFTLIEIMVVVGISALLLAVVIGGQREFARRKTSENAVVEITSKLRQIQNQSTSGIKPTVAGCQGNFRLEGYSVTFSSNNYRFEAHCSDGTTTNEVQIETNNYPAGVQVTQYPAQEILFKSVGRGTNLNSSARLVVCAFGYGKELSINIQGDIASRDVTC